MDSGGSGDFCSADSGRIVPGLRRIHQRGQVDTSCLGGASPASAAASVYRSGAQLSPYDRLRWEAERLGAGTHRIACPWCLGGSDGERSLSLGVAASGSIYFRCFRSTCGKSGGKKGAVVAKKPPRYFTANTEHLSPERAQWFMEKFGFVPCSTRYAPFLDRYVYTMWEPQGTKSRGYIARSFGDLEPKALTYNERPDEPFIGWSVSPLYIPGDAPIVIVEDWVSSEKVAAAGGVGVTLSGTHLSGDGALEIAENAKDRRVVIALDKDAFAKGVGIASLYGGLFGRRPRVWRLDKDLKYVDVGVIQRAMNDDDCNDFGDEWARGANSQSVH